MDSNHSWNFSNTKHSTNAIPNSWYTMENMWKIPTRFSAFLNKQFAEIFYTKRLELHLCDRLVAHNTRKCLYSIKNLSKPRLYNKSTESTREVLPYELGREYFCVHYGLMCWGGRHNYVTYSTFFFRLDFFFWRNIFMRKRIEIAVKV